MTSGGQSGQGTTISGVSSGAIGNVYSIVWSGPEVGEIDVTTNASTSSWKETIRDVKDPGVLNVKTFYTKAAKDALISHIGQAAEVWTVTYPDAGTLVVSGFVQGMPIEQTKGEAILTMFKIRLTGAPA